MTTALRAGRRAALSIAALVALNCGVLSQPAHAANTEVGGCTRVRTAAQLQAMKNHPTDSYCLVADIDAGSIANFTPVGNAATPFTGRFFGNDHVIRNLKIANTTAATAGLFGTVIGGLIQDVGLVDADVSSTIASELGALAGEVEGTARIQRVYSTGRVRCPADVMSCINGGLIGVITTGEVSYAWSSARVDGGYALGGLIGASGGAGMAVRNSYATGDVTCSGSDCLVTGGFIGEIVTNDTVTESFATGRVACPNCLLGGFVGDLIGSAVVTNVYATGAVVGGMNANAGGLIGLQSDSSAKWCFATGPVQGGSGSVVGGLIGQIIGSPSVTQCYWDSDITGQMTSAGGFGTALTTVQLRNALPSGFSAGSWGINRGLSYPFLVTNGFSSNLATLVRANRIYTALPIMQGDKSQYAGNPVHTAAASLATVYTMAARAIGQTRGVARLDDVKINKYFWHDATQRTTFAGPITSHATLTPMKPIAPATPLNNANVIGKLNAQNWVVLRGTYQKPGGGTGTHYMLATLYTKRGPAAELVIANDPFTGEQIAIDPATKDVVVPNNFPLPGFKVNGYATISNIH
jgi:hypothetical protein